MIGVMVDPVLPSGGASGLPPADRQRPGLPFELVGGFSPAVDDIEARLLGQRRSMGLREVSARASVSLVGARKFWHALGFPKVEEEDTVFTVADLMALQSLSALVRDGVFDQRTALAMTRAFARTTDNLAVWQVQLMAEAIGDLSLIAEDPGSAEKAEAGAGLSRTGAMPDPATARAAAMKLADIADDLEPLLIYAWRRHLSAAISRMVADAVLIENRPGVIRSVGFADLVSFTRLVSRLSERELARMVQRFEPGHQDGGGRGHVRGDGCRARRRHRARPGPGHGRGLRRAGRSGGYGERACGLTTW